MSSSSIRSEVSFRTTKSGSLLILAQIDMIDQGTLERVRGLIKTLNPAAKTIETSLNPSKRATPEQISEAIDVHAILATSAYSEETSVKGKGWLRSVRDMSVIDNHGRKVMAPKPETLEYGINSFVYTARKPFHPERLFKLVHDKFVIFEPTEELEDDKEDEDDEEHGEGEQMGAKGKKMGTLSDSDEGAEANGTDSASDHSDSGTDATSVSVHEVDSASPDEEEAVDSKYEQLNLSARLANKKDHPAFSRLLRSKGFIWLATRPYISGDWSQAGAMLTVSGGIEWFDGRPEDEWGSPSREVTDLIKKDFQGEWGDRRQEIVFIGENIDQNRITTLFDDCLLTDEEMAGFTRVMIRDLTREGKEKLLEAMFEDGWEDWPGVVPHDGEDDHDHDHAGHAHPH